MKKFVMFLCCCLLLVSCDGYDTEPSREDILFFEYVELNDSFPYWETEWFAGSGEPAIFRVESAIALGVQYFYNLGFADMDEYADYKAQRVFFDVASETWIIEMWADGMEDNIWKIAISQRTGQVIKVWETRSGEENGSFSDY